MILLQSKLTVYAIAKDKTKTPLGEADMNLCDYGENDYRTLKLNLKKCEDPNAYIEVAIRGTQAQEKTPRNRESLTSNNDQLAMAL